MQLETVFNDRAAMTTYLAEALAGLYSTEPIPASIHGGRAAALAELAAFDGVGYPSRNFVGANTSRLSAYIRHGVLSVAEVAEHARRVMTGKARQEFLKQLSWHVFFALVLEKHGEAVLENLEAPKYPARWHNELPEDVRHADTGLPCVDAWLNTLFTTGYLHNHQRLWFAAYLVHWRKVHWKAGYRLFREHLLDGDIASNALSWQWVASTFSSKPYFMNQDNINHYSRGEHCKSCKVKCPFRGAYSDLEQQLFGGNHGWSS
jgi:deoxyribodipyrimidine photo-lyase